jgi:hypothetical protein
MFYRRLVAAHAGMPFVCAHSPVAVSTASVPTANAFFGSCGDAKPVSHNDMRGRMLFPRVAVRDTVTIPLLGSSGLAQSYFSWIKL